MAWPLGPWVKLSDQRLPGATNWPAIGSFARVIPLPVDVDPDKVKARLAHGVLTLTMPKSNDVQKEEGRESSGKKPPSLSPSSRTSYGCQVTFLSTSRS
jgi:hypothetical protein